MDTRCIQSNLKIIIDTLKHINDRMFVDHIYYINLDSRTDRRAHIENQIKKYLDTNLNHTTRIPGVVVNNKLKVDGAIGCSTAHYNVMVDAIKHNYNRILVLEDDFEFICDKTKIYEDIHNFINNYPNFDIFLLSYGNHQCKKIDSLIDTVQQSHSASGYIICKDVFKLFQDLCSRSIDKLKRTKSVCNSAIDVLWAEIMKTRKKTYKFNYRIGKQIDSYSDIEKRNVSYGV